MAGMNTSLVAPSLSMGAAPAMKGAGLLGQMGKGLENFQKVQQDMPQEQQQQPPPMPQGPPPDAPSFMQAAGMGGSLDMPMGMDEEKKRRMLLQAIGV